MKVIKQIGRYDVTFGGEVHSGWLPSGAAEAKQTAAVTVPVNLVILGPRRSPLNRSVRRTKGRVRKPTGALSCEG